MHSFVETILVWYGLDLSKEDYAHTDLMAHSSFVVSDPPWEPFQWMLYMHEEDVSKEMHACMLDLAWRIAIHLQGPNERSLIWLTWWEMLHHVSPEYSKVSGCFEYMYSTKLDYVPLHSEDELNCWKDWLAACSYRLIEKGATLASVIPFISYPKWLYAVAGSHQNAILEIDNVINVPLTAHNPPVDYARQQWLSWTLRKRFPEDTYCINDAVYCVFQEYGARPEDVSSLRDCWKHSIFSALDLEHGMPSWLTADSNILKYNNWPMDLSFWIALSRVYALHNDGIVFEHFHHYYPEQMNFIERTLMWLNICVNDHNSSAYAKGHLLHKMYTQPILTGIPIDFS